MNSGILLVVGIGYGILLFLIASYGDRLARRGRAPILQTPLVYTLSIAIYCTAWTLYGAVGSAARNGLEFLAIYIGPSIAFFSWWLILRKIVTISKRHNITSIADFIASRFGKSAALGVLVTLISFLATTPYISLQLQSISQSIGAVTVDADAGNGYRGTAFIAALALAAFAILFGTRHALVNERHHGVVAAIAVEGLVKLVAIVVVGTVVIVEFGGLGEVLRSNEAQTLLARPIFTSRWFGFIALSFMAVLVLPRMFHVLVVENQGEAQLATAAWAFPLYLLVLNFFVFPIAIVGNNLLGATANPDYFVLTVPLASGHPFVAYLGFIGGFSAATSMIIVTAIAVSTMISNHVFLPIWLDARGNSQNTDDVRVVLLRVRRISIIGILLASFVYFDLSGTNNDLSSVGLIAFVGVAQIFPALIAALYWRGATRLGVGIGMGVGTLIWFNLLYLPQIRISFDAVGVSDTLRTAFFKPITGDTFIDAAIWSIGLNATLMIFISMFTLSRPLERLQANSYFFALDPRRGEGAIQRHSDLSAQDFLPLAQRILGEVETRRLFRDIAHEQDRQGDLPAVNDFFFERLERAIGGVIGSAMAHALISQTTDQTTVPFTETIKLADETIQNLEYARELEQQRQKLEESANALREANAALIALGAQRDAFLSQISHELRTPMTALQSFTDLLRSEPPPSFTDQKRMLEIMAAENRRLTKLLDEILDLSYLESGRVTMERRPVILQDAINDAKTATEPVWLRSALSIKMCLPEQDIVVMGDYDRLLQILINIITNAAKYVTAPSPQLEISITKKRGEYRVEFADNGQGIPANLHEAVFEKFNRGQNTELAGSAGLGLAISREIAVNLGGNLVIVPTIEGTTFRLTLPMAQDKLAVTNQLPAQ